MLRREILPEILAIPVTFRKQQCASPGQDFHVFLP